MICQVCLRGTLEEEPGHTYRCSYCNAHGTVLEIQKQALNKIDERWAFYYCPELNCRCFYRRTYEGHYRPILKTRVWCPAMQSHVTIEFLGLGEEGASKQSALPIFPVDLYHTPHRLDPHPSRTVNQELMDEWEATVAFALAEYEVD